MKYNKEIDNIASDKFIQITNVCREMEALRKQRDFLLESNNRLVEERRMAVLEKDKAYLLLEKANGSRAELLDKLESARRDHPEYLLSQEGL